MSEQEFNAIFSRKLKLYLSNNNMTQKELADKLNVSTASVTNWCKGLKFPRMDKIDAMCSIFDCNRSDLMEDRPAEKQAISKEEMNILLTYRKADTLTKAMVLRTLGIEKNAEQQDA